MRSRDDTTIIGALIFALVVFLSLSFSKNYQGNTSTALEIDSSKNSGIFDNKYTVIEKKKELRVDFDPVLEPIFEEKMSFISASAVHNFLPIANLDISSPEVDARSVFVYDLTKEKVLFEKSSEEKMPIASITKLMTAIVIMENYKEKLDVPLVVSQRAVETYGLMGNFRVGESMTVRNLLHALLIESSNDAATILQEGLVDKGDIVDLMNEKVKEMGLKKTVFRDPAGLDIETESSAMDLAVIAERVMDFPEILEIMRLQSVDVYSIEGFSHHLTNTNKLLNSLPGIIFGKTGYTQEAGECFLFAHDFYEDKIIYVILNSPDRFGTARKLLNWLKEAYKWQAPLIK